MDENFTFFFKNSKFIFKHVQFYKEGKKKIKKEITEC